MTALLPEFKEFLDWESFENEVRQLLQLQGWVVQRELQIGHKKVDAYAERLGDFLKRHRAGVECKLSEKHLSMDVVSTIYADYLPLLQKGLIDSILLVTLNGLTAQAEAFAQSAQGFAHITYNDLLNSSMDFTAYVQGMKAQYTEDQLNLLYVSQPYTMTEGTGGVDIAEELFSWDQQFDTTRPVAVLGGYGMGKSTLARRLTFLLAEKYLQDARSRIPVLLKLEEIGTEQSLEGLLGAHFTSFSLVRNYSFPIFMHLNTLGRFVILLDGFDEMKKTMSWESMLFNLEQLNRLVVPRSRVILLGRPTAFLSKDEYDEALHGRRRVLNTEHSIPGWPDFREVYLGPFQAPQISLFIKKHIALFQARGDVVEKIERLERLKYTLEGPYDKRLRDLTNRPVQLKMLLEIFPNYKGKIDSLTEAVLYSEFIDLVIRREVTKRSRTTFTVRDRRKFASRLAFWMWENDIGTSVKVSEVPDEVFSDFTRPSTPLDSIKRDLLAGCFLERKPPEGLYFPHRSFLEFLIAERLIEMIEEHNEIILSIRFISPEIIEFFNELVGKRALDYWLTWMLRIRGSTVWSPQSIDLFVIACDTKGLRIATSILDDLRKNTSKVERLMPMPIESITKTALARDKKDKRIKRRFPHRVEGVTKKHHFRR